MKLTHSRSIYSTEYGYAGQLTLMSASDPTYGEDYTQLFFEVAFETTQHLRVRITDASQSRYEVKGVLQPDRFIDHDEVRFTAGIPAACG